MLTGSRRILSTLLGTERRDPPPSSAAPAPLFPPRDPAADPAPDMLPPAPLPAIVIDPPRPEPPPQAALPPDIPPPAPPPAPVVVAPPVAAPSVVAPGAAPPPRPALLASALEEPPAPLPVPSPVAAAPASAFLDGDFTAFVECRDLRHGAVVVTQPGFWGGQALRVVVAPGGLGRDPRPLLTGTLRFTSEAIATLHRTPAKPAPELACTFLTDAIVTGPGHVWHRGTLLTAPEIMPDYVRHLHNIPADGAAMLVAHQLKQREIAAPCVVLAGHGLQLYGHFLIEMLFRILLVRRLLRGSGLAVRWLLDAQAPAWLLRILHADLGISPAEIELFRPAEERVILRHAILPGLVAGQGGFHAHADTLIGDLLASLSPLPEAPARRLFVVRTGVQTSKPLPRDCRNEAALVAIAAARGFVAVATQDVPWRQQLALFRNAEIVVGAFGSGLQTALVSPASTRLGVIGWLNAVQSQIATLRGQRIAYLTEGVTLDGQYEVPEAAFTEFLDAICDPAAAG
jgi:capsular polysaccharide biosynthesis protein